MEVGNVSSKMSVIPHISSYDDIRAEMMRDLRYRLSDRNEKTSLGRPLYYRINVQLITTQECPFNCPFCLERQNPMTGDNDFRAQIEALKMVLAEHPNARLSITGGEPGLYPEHISNVVDSTIPEYAAEKAGIQSGDVIVELNGKKVDNKYDLDDIMQNATGEDILVKVERNEETLEIHVKPTEVKSKVTGMYLDDKCQVIMVDKGSSSEKQGIQANDVITKINNIETNGNTNKIIEALQQEETESIALTIQRGKAEINIEFTPDYVSNYYLGVNMKMAPDTFLNRCYYGLVETKTFVFSIVDNVKQLFTGNVGIDQMTGPIGIGEMVSQTNGFKEFIYLMALISISLGVTNLLPIPALDGGKILILIIEAIRRKPMKPENEINIQLLGFSILIALSIYVSYNDILRLF